MLNSANIEKINYGISHVNPKVKVFKQRDVKYNITEEKTHQILDLQISTIVIHTTSLESVEKAVLVYHEYGVSAHFIIDVDGKIFLLVPIELCAFHAGNSFFGKLNNIGIHGYGIETINSLNPISIGIEFLTPNHHIISDKQIAAYEKIVENLKKEYPKIENILCHSTIATDRKNDPSILSIMSLKNAKIGNLTLLPNKLEYKKHEFIKKCFLNQHSLSRKNIEEAGHFLGILGYKINGWANDKTLFTQVIDAICDYLKILEPEIFLSAEILEYLSNKIAENTSIKFVKNIIETKNIDILNKVPSALRKVYLSLLMVENIEAKNLFHQMEIDSNTLKCIENLQNPRIVNETFLKLFFEE
ncbi:N-acetylmuramoyl-L-alanine amidase AmiD precursor [Candidatus Deianiraea vastatrix]|uniref:N-acetylmuramoyl-L-alanine amidase n=2 Tax=Candidatus Deianiraea vastatrix TaxID=2163644 RepID=A0A5B8XC63_9RICK|nr:N-acetylmuramoyl-L-alanine amidase AmiD precursor [Candidatus Deianiraea vastatrix]